MAEENKIPALEAISEEENAKGEQTNFDDWHDGHIERVKKGLQTIIASEDLNEIKAIAQSLLEEETEEGEIEKSSEDKKGELSMADYLEGK